MHFARFHYKVLAELELSGRELEMLRHHAEHHYDHTCKIFFEHGHTGYGWLNEFRWGNADAEPHDCQDGKVALEVESRTLDLCMKILECIGHRDEVAGSAATQLREQMRETFGKMQEEWGRLEKAAAPPSKFDGALKCPHCGSEEVEWQEYVLHTRQLIGVRDGTVFVDMNSEKAEYECCKDEALSCRSCFGDFPVPDGLGLEHADEHDFEAQEEPA